MRWVIAVALIIAAVGAYLIKAGVTVQSSEKSRLRPGRQAETRVEQQDAAFQRARSTIRDIQKQKNEEARQFE
jgi:uncharacterized protein HemX